MALRKLLMVGIFVLMVGDGTMAVSYQIPGPPVANGEIKLISSYCHRHPERCHPHRHRHPHWGVENWYHKDYRQWAKHCRHHPYREECQRLCYLNRDVCYR